MFPRDPESARRYGRHKVIAILVTFGVLWVTIRILYPGGVSVDPEVLFRRSPEELFRERVSGRVVQITGAVEGVLPDSVIAGGARLRRLHVRTDTGHPLLVFLDGPEAPPALSPGERIALRGTYEWSTRGGVVHTATPGEGEKPGWLRRIPADVSAGAAPGP